MRDGSPRRTAEVTGIKELAVRQAAEWWGTARTSFLMHACGMEQHARGVNNVLASINNVLASGRIARPGCGYSTITGQGTGQGGRERVQKCDQLRRHLVKRIPLGYEHGYWAAVFPPWA